MKTVRLLLVFGTLAMITAGGPPTHAIGGGWSDTIYYDSADWNYAVGERRVDGCNPENRINWGVTSAWKEVSSDTCDGNSYNCYRCFVDNNGIEHCDWICPL
jgi:hypothetical protein